MGVKMSPQSQYFISKFSEIDQKSLHESPNMFLTSRKQQLTHMVRKDMRQLATIAMPVHNVDYNCDQWDSWTDHHYWYYVKKCDKDTVANMFDVYYNICGLHILDRWDFNGKPVFELKVPSDTTEIKDVIFNCLRTIYFYNNYYKQNMWDMIIPYDDRLHTNTSNYNEDFIKTEYLPHGQFGYKMLYTKPELFHQINKYCSNIAEKVASLINCDICAEKRQTDVAQAEIEKAYNVLRRYGLMPENPEKTR